MECVALWAQLFLHRFTIPVSLPVNPALHVTLVIPSLMPKTAPSQGEKLLSRSQLDSRQLQVRYTAAIVKVHSYDTGGFGSTQQTF